MGWLTALAVFSYMKRAFVVNSWTLPFPLNTPSGSSLTSRKGNGAELMQSRGFPAAG